MIPRHLFIPLFCLTLPLTMFANEPEVLVFTNAQSAVLDPANWDAPYPNERYFDALRPLLIRYPGIAQTIRDKEAAGFRVDKVELSLTWERQEGAGPQRGRSGWGANEQYKENPGKWSATIWPLLRPWDASDTSLAPTWNAWLPNSACWSRGGGNGNGSDRLDLPLGPRPLHADAKTALFNLTPLFQDKNYGRTPGERLRRFEECGLQIYKSELYDMKYRNFYAYDWAVSTGYIRIWIKRPELRVAFIKDNTARPATLPPPVKLQQLAPKVSRSKQNQPAIAVPANHAQIVAQLLARPTNLPQWQWQRINELRQLHADPADSTLSLGRGVNFAAFFSSNSTNYLNAVQNLLAMPPRTWQGHLTSDFALLAVAYGALLPPGARDYLHEYWRAWLMPEIEQPFDEFLGGGTHRGGPTYFRGYTRSMGTMNFTHNANMGAMLGSQFLNSETVITNARYGVENLLLRAHVFANGAHQEIGDTYYQALTMGAAGALAHYAAHPFDRLMGSILRDRLVEPLISMYHPGLRRMTHPMGRGSFTYHLLLQEGSYHVLHTLSPSGTLIHLNDLKPERQRTPGSWGSVHGLTILGDEGPPERIGLLAPWVEIPLADKIASVTDGKTYPWQVFARDSSPGSLPNGFHVNAMGRNYALASRDNANYDYGVSSIIAQWRHKPEQVASVEDLSTLIVGFSSNERFARELSNSGGFGVLQAGGKLIALKALPDLNQSAFRNEKDGITALHASALLVALGDTGQREIWINDQPVAELSGAKSDPGGDWRRRLGGEPLAFANDTDLITISDGSTYVALIPVTINALKRDRQITISCNYPALMINVHIYRDSTPLSAATLAAATPPPSAGFVLELADATDYTDFAAFRRHIREAKLNLSWDNAANYARFTYSSGDDTLEMDYDPRRHPAIRRTVNNSPAYPDTGIERSSPWAVQGRSGTIIKSGVILESEPLHEAYLQVFPGVDTIVAYNPLPDPTFWSLTLPESDKLPGKFLVANGRLGLARIIIERSQNRISVEHAWRPNTETTPDSATLLFAVGWPQAPQVQLNGQPLHGKLRYIEEKRGQRTWLIPLNADTKPDPRTALAQYLNIDDKFATAHSPLITDWHVIGPFDPDFNTAYPPENGVDLNATCQGLDGADVKWRTIDITAQNDRGGIDLNRIYRPETLQLAYAYTHIESDTDRQATFFFGSPTDAAIWINGQLVHQHRRYYRIFMPDQDRFTAPLRQGHNEILIKILRNHESWAFSLRPTP